MVKERRHAEVDEREAALVDEDIRGAHVVMEYAPRVKPVEYGHKLCDECVDFCGREDGAVPEHTVEGAPFHKRLQEKGTPAFVSCHAEPFGRIAAVLVKSEGERGGFSP